MIDVIMGAEVVVDIGFKRCVKGQGLLSCCVSRLVCLFTCWLFASRIMFRVVSGGN